MVPHSIWANIAETSWWFYLLLFFLFKIGFNATKPRIVNAKYLFILPFISLSIFIVCLVTFLTFNYQNVAAWLAALLAGMTFSAIQLHLLKIKVLKDDVTKLYVPGSWLFLVITSALIFAKSYYGFQFQFDIDPLNLTQPRYALPLYALFGFGFGNAFGRGLYILRRMKKGPYVTLQGEPA